MVLVASLFSYFHSWNACRMYQALLASGDNKSAKIMLNKFPKDDPHVRCVIKACDRSYIVSNSENSMKKKKQKEKRWSETQNWSNEISYTDVQFCLLERYLSPRALCSEVTSISNSYLWETEPLSHVTLSLWVSIVFNLQNSLRLWHILSFDFRHWFFFFFPW